MRSTRRARSLARLLYRRQSHQECFRILTKTCSCHCCTYGYALAGVPCSRSDHCLAASHEPYWLDLLWRRTTLHSAALRPGVRQLRTAREFRISRWGVHGLVLRVGKSRKSSLSGNLRDVAVPRRQSTISSVANRRVDGSLRSGVVRTLRCLLSAGCGYLCLRYEPVRMGRGIWVGVIGVGLTTYGFLNYSALIGETLLLTGILAAICSLALRLHRARGDERQQLKWFLYAAVPAALCFSVAWLSFTVVDFTQLVFGTPFLPDWAENLDNILYIGVFFLLFVPIFTYIAIVRYHLYDINVVINRTLVYGALMACVVGIYVLAVVALGTLFQAQSNLAVSLLATGLVAVLFQPLRGRLQRGVNRLMYGERDDPYAVISRLG